MASIASGSGLGIVGDRHGEHRDLPNRRDPDRVYHEKNKHSDQTGGNPKGDWAQVALVGGGWCRWACCLW